jgi:hypothetical protein
MPEASVLFGVIKQMRAVKPIIIGVRTNKECPDGFVRLITVRSARLNNEIRPAFCRSPPECEYVTEKM